MGEPGDRRPALRSANHNHHAAGDNVFVDLKHDGDNTGNAGYAAVNNKLIKHHKHDAHAGRRNTNDDDDVEHDNDARKLSHPARRWRTMLVLERADHDGHGAKSSLYGEQIEVQAPGRYAPASVLTPDCRCRRLNLPVTEAA